MTLYTGIIIDPPWAYGSPRALVGNGGRGKQGAAGITQVDVASHYATLSLEELRALIIPAAKDAALFLWVTNPFLCDGSAASLVKSWGFNPKTVLSWLKVQADGVTPSRKTGHWFRSASEHVIFATRGRLQRPSNWGAIPTWFHRPRLPHSVKPDIIHEYAEKITPSGPWLEMFARRSRPGWATWGDQAPAAENLEDL